jgi:hypothetical protein
MGRPALGVLIGFTCVATGVATERGPSRLETTPILVEVTPGPSCPADGVMDLAYSARGENWLVVQCAVGAISGVPAEPSRIMPIAAIRFIDSRPTNVVTVSLDSARGLLDREEAQTSGAGRGFAPLRELRLGRMVGRAIAHEVGHFLIQSGSHTPRGLMRATHSVAALTGASLGPFKVDEDHVRALQARRATAGAALEVSQY